MKEVHKIKYKTPEKKGVEKALGKSSSKARRGSAVTFPLKWIVVGIIVMAMIGSVVVIKPGLPSGPDDNPNTTPAECIEGKTIQASFTLTLHIYVTDLSVGKDNYTHPITNNLGKDPIDDKTCTRRLYTGSEDEYDASRDAAIIHVQSPEARDYTLGDFFSIAWHNQTLAPGKILSYWYEQPYGWRIVMKVNGQVISDTDNDLGSYHYENYLLRPDRIIDFYVSR